MDNYLNQVLNDRYEIQEVIGVGGMSVVYKAYDRVDDRIVAVKILKDEYLQNEEFRTRFKNESQAIAVLSHPNIVKVYDVCFGDDLQYIVMEHVEGITLKEYIKRQKVLDWKEAVYFVIQILKALQHAHDKGVIHRDIKPQNILLLQNTSIKVTDFGIAQFNRGANALSGDNAAIGSVHYVSPEQARGEYTDEKSDIYSVGVVLYEMLTGRVPFDAENDENVAIMQMNSDAVKPTEINPAIPMGLEQITLKAMQKNPADRYQSAAEFLADIDEFKRNPAMLFDYSYLVDKNPTKYMDYQPAEKRVVMKKENTNKKEPEIENDDYDDDDYDSKNDRSSAIPILIGIAIAMVVIVALIIFFAFGDTIRDYFSDGNSSTSVTEEEDEGFLSKLDIFGWFGKNKIEAPNFINMKFEDALKKYPDLAIENPPQFEYNSSYEDGYICNQYPDAGTKVSKDTVFKLTVASSNQMVLITDVSGYSAKDAETALRAAGFNVEFVPRIDETKPEGEVLSTDPSANTYLEYNGTVYVYYASSAENIDSARVPHVVGYELSAAKKKIEAAGFTVGAVTHGASSASLKGFVISQTPVGMTAAKTNVPVNLVVGNGVPASNTLSFLVTLPALPSGQTGTIRTYLNNNAYDSIADVSMNGGKYQLSFTGTGSNNAFKIYVDSVLICTGNIDFTTSPPSYSNVRNYQYSSKESIPNVVGYSESAAQSELRAKGFFKIRCSYECSDTVAKDIVISQNPQYDPSAQYSTGTSIELVISCGPEDSPEPPVTDTPPTTLPPETTTSENDNKPTELTPSDD